MTNTTNGKITSVTIRARNGSFRCANEGYEDAQTLTVRSDGVATFVALGTRTDEYGHSVCNSVVRRSVVRLTDQQTQAVFSAFDGVLKKRFASRPMASFWMADSIADEFVIRYDGATVFYGMSMDGDCDACLQCTRCCVIPCKSRRCWHLPHPALNVPFAVFATQGRA